MARVNVLEEDNNSESFFDNFSRLSRARRAFYALMHGRGDRPQDTKITEKKQKEEDLEEMEDQASRTRFWVLQGMNENLQNLNRSVASGPGSLFQSGFAPNAAVEWVQGMEGTNMKAGGVATSKSKFPKNFGPQRNFVPGRGKGKMFPEEQKPCFPPVDTWRYTSHGPRNHANAGGSRLNSPSWCSKCNRKHEGGLFSGRTKHSFRCKETGHIKRHLSYVTAEYECYGHWTTSIYRQNGSKPTVGGFQPDVFPMCSKCGRKHVGTICPGSGNGCFHCKEKGHIRRFCPRLTQKVNIVEVGRPSTTGQVSTVSGTDTTDVDDLIRGNRMVTVSGCGKWCDVYRRFSLLVVIPVRFNSGDVLIVGTSGYD
ncbi:hypothetical protein Lal_00030248 [Lupinus albus]|nr:hypothetical protein Lal_00030248 [Lupinus albus]